MAEKIKRNVDEAKAPDDKSNWKAIDIFLFSNGQHHTPPRKYHLTVEELNWWNATLNQLARSQYGSLHSSIELYTIDGRKVKGPLDLQNSSHYVAVVPPDAFIDSGYEKYLIRASRSWEKRQCKRFTENETDDKTAGPNMQVCCPCPKHVDGRPEDNADGPCVQEIGKESQQEDSEFHTPAKINVLQKSPPSDKDESLMYTYAELTTIKTSDDNIAMESALTRPQRSSTPKLDVSEDMQSKPQINTAPHRSSMVRTDRKRSSGQHPSFARPATQHNPQFGKIANTLPKSKDAYHRKTLTKIPIKMNEHINNKSIKTKKVFPYPTKTIPLPVQVPALPDDTTPSEPKLLREPSSIVQQSDRPKTSISSNKSHPIGTPVIEDMISTQELIAVVTTRTKSLKSNSDIQSTDVEGNQTNPIAVTDEIVSCFIVDKGTDEAIQTEVDGSTKGVDIPNGHGFYPNSTELMPFTQNNSVIDPIDPVTENYIAVIRKSDAMDINLNKDSQNYKNEPKVNADESKHWEVREVSSLSEIFKKWKAENMPPEPPAKTKSMNSVLSGVNECYAKVVIVQCGCCGSNAVVPRIDNMPVFKDENGFFILIPGPTPAPTHSCGCGLRENDISQSEKKTTADLFLNDKPKPQTETIYPIVTQDVGVMMTVMHCGVRSQYDDAVKIYSDSAVTKQVCIQEDNNEDDNRRTSPQCTQKTDMAENKSNSKSKVSCKTVDIQTEWCCLLLQVKHHEDDRYSFHLPPLELVKYFSR